MRRWWGLVLALFLAGCGRIGFGAPSSDAVTGDVTDADSGSDASAATYPETVSADGPIAYWQLDEPSGTVAIDQRNTFPGTVSGPCTRSATGLDTAIAFDGNDETSCQIDVGDVMTFAGTAAFSIEAWFVHPAGIRPFQHIFERERRNGGPNDGYGLVVQDGVLPRTVFLERVVFNNQIVSSPELPIMDDTLHHVVGTFDGTELRIFLDGVDGGAFPDTRPIGPTPGAHAMIGVGPDPGDSGGNAFHGVLDEVAIYDRALSPAQVAHHHEVGQSSF